MREECFTADEMVSSLYANMKSSFELRLFNHDTGDVVYKRLTQQELTKVIEVLDLTVEGVND